ncbi:MAG TPA: lytic murein transglycosylase B [Steroidobacteraceae bacterium]|nr:lytic murein transglycosylase B [Steroidobacteraceae bacterium]
MSTHPSPLNRFAVLLLTATLALHTAQAAFASSSRHHHTGFDLTRPEIVSFVNDVVAHDTMKRKAVLALLAKAEPQPKIIELMTRPAEKVTPWWEYHDQFLTPERISLGVQFWADHRQTLESVAAERGVPPEYIIAIVGIETRYGRSTGKYRVLDALTTLAFDYPPRGDFFRGELEQFLLLAHEDKLNPLTTTGSYAGAMGAPQFMPSTYRHYAVDADTDNKRDLWRDWDDIIASVANYLQEHGWETSGPVLAEARLDPDPTFQLNPKIELSETVASLNAQGVKIDLPLPGDTPALLIPAEQQSGPAYRVGFKNFYVITRYNASTRYAMSVYDLAQAIAQRVRAAP